MKGKSALSESELSDLVAYFDKSVRESLSTNDLPLPFRKFDAAGAIEFEATLSRISENERLINYYEHRPVKALPRMPFVARPELWLQVIFTVGPSPDNPTERVIIGRRRVPNGKENHSAETVDENIIGHFEEYVRRAVLKDETFQDFEKHYFDGSMERR